MPKSNFVYVLYIAATPEAVWKGLVDSESTRQYWGHENVSDWKPGSPWEHRKADGSGTVSIAGEVIEARKPHRLVLTWSEHQEKKLRHRQSRVAFEIDELAGMVRLTLTHDEFEAGSTMERQFTTAWPRVLCSLKTLLETGKPLPAATGR
jgi:uncharacterized protein YndB with AHSA1/START domain